MEKSKQELDLFHDYLIDFSNNLKQYGKLSYNVYNLKYFVYDTPEKSKPFIQREIKINNDKLTVNLTPQTVFNKTKVETRYLGEVEDDIFSFIMYSYSKNPQFIQNRHCVMITLKEINSIFKYNFKKIKESLDLLSKYKVYFNMNNFNGVLPVQFIDGFVYDQKTRKTLVYIPFEIKQFIEDNRYIIMNYQQLFSLKNRISKLLYKRINITNMMNFENKVQFLKLPETICSFLRNYGIEYKTRYQKSRLFNEVVKGLDELKEHNIISSYNLIPIEKSYEEDTRIIKTKRLIDDYRVELFLHPNFCLKYSVSQKGKKLLEVY